MSIGPFKYVADSQSGHCCFDWTVVDTRKPVMINGRPYKDQCEAICETFTEDAAKQVTAALNLAESAL